MDHVIAHYLNQNPEKLSELRKGQIVEVMGKHYGVCGNCECIIRVDKPIFGSTHFCTP